MREDWDSSGKEDARIVNQETMVSKYIDLNNKAGTTQIRSSSLLSSLLSSSPDVRLSCRYRVAVM